MSEHKEKISVIETIADSAAPVWESPAIVLVELSQTSVTFQWKGVAPGAVVYGVYEGERLLGTVDAEKDTYTVDGLIPGTKHIFSVQAGDRDGNWSKNGPVKLFTTCDYVLPCWPSGKIEASHVRETSVTLLWDGAEDNGVISAYRIYKNGELASTVSGGIHTCSVQDLVHDTKYLFRVEAVDGLNNESIDGPSVEVDTLHSGDTTAPDWINGILEASAVTESGLTLRWSGAVDDEEVRRYRLWYGDKLAAVLDGSADHCEVSGLESGKQHTFTIQAGDGAGNWSENGPELKVATKAAEEAIKSISNVEQLNLALVNAKPGECILLEQGVYDGEIHSVQGLHGRADAPVVLRAASKGLVEITGEAGFHFAGCSHITLEGIKFTGAGRSYKDRHRRAVLLEGCNHMRITGCHFKLEETDDNTTFVLIKGEMSHHHRIDRNLFDGKHKSGLVLDIAGGAAQVSQYDRIEYNHFKDNVPWIENGKETVRIGLSGLSQTCSYSVIQSNLFENCGGEPEIISIKCCDTDVRYNTFLNSPGQVVLRHGDRNRVYGNYFINAEEKKNAGGIRVYGTDHKIYNNYMQGLTAPAVQIDKGNAHTSGKLTAHWTPRRIEVCFNTMVDCSAGIQIGKRYKDEPEDCIIANNIVEGSSNCLIDEYGAPVRFIYKGNIVFPKDEAAAYRMEKNPSEVWVADPLLQKQGVLYRLSGSSPAIGKAAGGFDYITEDLDRQPRGSIKTVGAEEYSEKKRERKSLQPLDVGLYAARDDFSWNDEEGITIKL